MVPSVLLSGFATPIENMPGWLQPISYLIPMKYMLFVSKGIFLKNHPCIHYFSQHLAACHHRDRQSHSCRPALQKETSMRNWIFVVIAISFGAGGYLVGPNYCPPNVALPEQWSSEAASSNLCVANCEPPLTAWWQLFCDPLLDKYIAMAAHHNQEILAAEANICQARAMRQVTAAPPFPLCECGSFDNPQLFSKNGPLFTSSPGNISEWYLSRGTTSGQTIYFPLLDAYWEIDLFGKTRRAVEAANANIGSAIEQRNDLLLSILAEVALNYMQLRSNQIRGKLS